MSNQTRRSLRLRISNLPEEATESVQITQKEVSTKRPQPAPSTSSKEPPKRGKKKIANESVDETKRDENDDEVEKKEQKEEVKETNIETMKKKRQPRKRMAKGEKKDDDESSPKKKTKGDTEKNRRMVSKNEEKMEEEKEEGMEEDEKESRPLPSPVKENGRPRRGCAKKTVEKYDDLMSGSASSSDASSSESEVEDSDLEMEIKKAKRRREIVKGTTKGKRKQESTEESSSDSVSEEEEEEEEEDNEGEEEREGPAKKRARGGPSSFHRGGCNRNGGGRGRKTPIQRPKKGEKELPVKIMHDRVYEVDYEEMVGWEAKSVKMVRDLRELERETSNGGQIMENVNEFIQRCLEGGRMNEMDAEESVRVTHKHEEELDERNRRKNMNVVQRMKEQMQKEKREEEKEGEESSDDEEEDEWEEMETVEGIEKTKNTVEVTIEKKKKLKAPWKAKWIRQEVNREVRQRCENVHKIHLLSYMSHLRHLMAEGTCLTRKDGGIPLSARALSLIPPHLVITNEKTKKKKEKITVDTKMYELIEWWRNEFKKVTKVSAKKWEGLSEEKRLNEMMENREFDTSKHAAVLFLSFSSLLLVPIRLIARCVVITKKPEENTPIPTKGSTSKSTKTVEEKKEESPKKKEESIEYWCELWNEEKKTWRVFDPSIVSTKKEKRKGRKWKKGEEVEEEVKEENDTMHREPFHSMMGKDGDVLYFIAVDRDFSLRDVSSRYLNGKDLISRELRGRRANEEWLTELWMNKEWRVNLATGSLEEEEWMDEMRRMEMPKTVTAFKDHPLYVLDRDVLKMQMIFPYDTEPIGVIRDCKIYLRKFLRPINTSKWYEKMGRQIKKDEPPCAEKQGTNPFNGEKGTQGLYGYWQTERWNGGEVEEGRLPRNEFDNVYLYQPEMCPRGGIYLEPEGIQRVASELGKDFVPAVLAWYYKGGMTIPLIRGAVYLKEDVPELLAAWRVSYQRWKEEERKIRISRCLSNWKKLIKGMMRLSEMRKEFAPIEKEKKKKKGEILDDDGVMEEGKTSWPAKKYGGELFK